jgi:hypothetical protein
MKFVFTPFLIYILMDIIFCWNIWLVLVPNEWLTKYDDYSVSFFSLFVPVFSTFFFLVGYIGCHLFIKEFCGLPCGGKHIDRYVSEPILIGDKRSYQYICICLLILGCVSGFGYYKDIPPAVKGVRAFVSDSDFGKMRGMVSKGRKEITKGHVLGGRYRGQGVLKRFSNAIWSYGTILSFLMVLVVKSRLWWFLFMTNLVGSLFFIGGTGERGPLLWLIVTIVISWSYVVKLRFKRILLLGLVMFCLFAIITVVSPRYSVRGSRGEVLSSLVQSIANRLVQGGKRNNVRIINFIDDGILDYGYGKEHFNLVRNAMPGYHYPPLSHRLATIKMGETTTYFSHTYLGLVYLDFGLMGVVIIYLIIGCSIPFIFGKLLKMRKQVENLVFLSLSCFILGNMPNASGFILLPFQLFPIFIIHSFVVMFRNISLTISVFSRYIIYDNL